jgi:hypothetical protein
MVFASFLIEPFTDLFNYQNFLLKNQTVFDTFHNMGISNENVGAGYDISGKQHSHGQRNDGERNSGGRNASGN